MGLCDLGDPVGVLDRDPQLLRHDPARVIGRAVWRLGATEQKALLAALDALDAADEPEPALGEHKLIGNGTAKDGETDS